jgi:hypothetical protein
MDKICIIGSGFSSYILYNKLKKFNIDIISPENVLLDNQNLFRRKNLEYNKFYKLKKKSYGSLNFKIKKNSLQDNLIIGGNSNYWGGFCDTNNFTKKEYSLLDKSNILIKDLNYSKNFCSSNNDTIAQLTNNKSEIFSIKKKFFKDATFIDGYVTKIKFKKKIIVEFICKNSLIEKKYSNVFLATSIPQVLDIIYNSKFLNKNTNITLDDFIQNFNFSIFGHITNTDTVIKYNFPGILKHSFGNNTYFKYTKILPLYLEQIFTQNKIKRFLKYNYKKKEIIDDYNNIFLSTAHSCNLVIAKNNIKKFLYNINKNLHIIGTSSVVQNKNGPISNEIVKDIIKRF